MEPATIVDDVMRVVEEIGGVKVDGPDADFYDAGGIGSMNAVQLLVELEERFDVQINEDRFIGSRTCRELADLIAG